MLKWFLLPVVFTLGILCLNSSNNNYRYSNASYDSNTIANIILNSRYASSSTKSIINEFKNRETTALVVLVGGFFIISFFSIIFWWIMIEDNKNMLNRAINAYNNELRRGLEEEIS